MKELMHVLRSKLLIFGSAAILFIAIFQPLLQNVAYADAASDMAAMNNRFYAGVFLRDCIYQMVTQGKVGSIEMGRNIARSIAQNPETMFTGGVSTGYTGLDGIGVHVGQYYAPDSGELKCNKNGAAVTKALNDFGIGAQNLFLSVGYKLGTSNVNGTDVPTYTLNGSSLDFDSFLNKRLIQTDPAKYVELSSVFSKKCTINIPPGDGDDVVTVKKIVQGDDKKYNSEDEKAGFSVKSAGTTNGGQATVRMADVKVVKYDYNVGDTSCKDLLNRINQLVPSVIVYNNTHDEAIQNGVQASDTEASDEGSDDSKVTCSIEGIGWLVCPAMVFMADITDKAYSFLSTNFLSINVGMVTGANNAWAKFRDIANIAFVIALLFVVYSQITSVGITNYGIKKMLPRIIIAAVLVNVSFIICQLAVDLSNILGYGVSNLFVSIDVGGTPPDASAVTWSGVIGVVLAGTAVLGIVLAISVPVLLAALLAIGLIVLILVGRQALIVLLVAVAPLAFVAYLLPNTEQWFKKWVKLFSTLLLLFPIIGIVFGASQLAANIIISVGDSSDNPTMYQLIALGVATIPFFVVPGLLKGALNAAGSFGTKLSGMAGKATGRLGKNVGDSRLGDWNKNRKQMAAIRSEKARAGIATRRLGGAANPANWVNGAAAGLNRTTNVLLPSSMRSNYARRATALEDQEFEESVKAATTSLGGRAFSDIQAMANDTKLSDADRTAAIRIVMEKGNFSQRRSMVESSNGMTQRQKTAVSSGVFARGDQAIYGASIGDAILSKNGLGADDTKQFVAENIAAGKVKAETIVHDADATKLMVDVATSGDTYNIVQKDGSGNPVLGGDGKPVKISRTLSAAEVDTVRTAANDADKVPGTKAKMADNIRSEIARL